MTQALTLADGVAGELKVIVHTVDGGSAVLTPTTKIGFSRGSRAGTSHYCEWEERDGSLDDSTGYELVSPAFNLYDDMLDQDLPGYTYITP